MDFTRYDASLQELNRKHLLYLAAGDKRSRTILRRILKEALRLDDSELTGYAYHQIAYVEYFVFGDYEAFLKNLHHSASILMRTGGGELITVYYLIAIDALNKGMYDVSFRYFQMARTLAMQVDREDFAAILDESIGYLLLHLEDYTMSRSYTRRSLKELKKHRSHPHYYENLITAYFNDGAACLKLGKIHQARSAYDQLGRLILQMETEGLDPGDDSLFSKAMLEAHLAIAERDAKKVRNSIDSICLYIPKVPQIVENIEDLKRICDELFLCGETDCVGRILNALNKITISPGAANARRILADLHVRYCLEAQKVRRLTKAFEEQDEVYSRLIHEQRESYRYVSELIQMTEDLQKERARIHMENKTLTHRVRTDALTGIANRYGMNQYLEEAFERAFRRKTNLGIGAVDVDGLKQYNDQYGHMAGDEILRQIGAMLSDTAKRHKNLFVSRYGGDEFMLIYEGMSDDEIRRIAEGIAAESPIGLTQGICNARPAGKDKSWDFLARADKALYEGKGTKERVIFTTWK